MRTFIIVAIIAALAWFGFATYQGQFTFTSKPTSTTTSNPTPVAQTVPVVSKELAHGTHSKVSTRTNYLITSKEQLLALWKIIDAPGQTPTVDFTKNDVVAVFSGDEPTAGHDIKVSAVEDSQSRMVQVVLSKPGESCAVGQTVTSPYQVIELPKTTLPLSHADQQVTTGCLL